MTQALNVVDGRQTPDLVVALHHAQRQVLGRDVDARHLVVLVADEVRRTAQGTVLAPHVGYLLLQLLRHPTVVAVAEGDVAALGALDGAVAGNARSVVLLQEFHFHTLVLVCKLFQNVARVVRRVVVGNEQLEVGIGLVKHTLDAVSKVFTGIECGHDD